jgi:glycerol-3-phosphate acyltransferase PlsY
MSNGSMLLAYSLAYLLGSIPVGFLLVKAVKGTDVRRVGSGNIGATNVTRAAGKGPGRLVFALDAVKGGLAAQVVAPWLLASTLEARLACGVAAVVGHCFPLFLGFRGGKGVATAIGVLLATMPRVAAGLLAIWAAVFVVTRTVSLASLAAAAGIPLLQLLLGHRGAPLVWGSGLGLLIILRHHANIDRLLRGEEHRFTGKP